ncbi:HigA family addiction module antitoxin [Photorhabdus tasmaniensis]
MIMHNPPHPGRVVSGEMEFLDISQRELARALNVAPSTIQRVIAEKASITPEMAVRLAHVIGSTPEQWLRLQDAYSLSKARGEIDLSKLNQLYTPQPIQPHI